MSDTSLSIIHNARIYCSGRDDFSWMVFCSESGLVKDVGYGNPPSEKYSEARRIDVDGKRILPGLHESHIHITLYGLSLSEVRVEGCSSIKELQERLKCYADSHTEKAWLVGGGWEQDVLGRYPTKEDLDEVCPDRPVVLFRACYHIAVVSSKALQLAGLDRSKGNLSKDEFDRFPSGHPQTGQLTGIVREVVDSTFQAFLQPTRQEKLDAVSRALQTCMRNGATSVHALELNTWDIFCELADQDKLPIRVFYAAYFVDRDESSFPQPGEKRGSNLYSDRIKLFSDGSLGAATAALGLTYKRCDHKGVLIHSQEHLNKLVHEATSSGYRLEIHAIGDRAAESTMQAIEAAKVTPEKRPIIVHCQILNQDLIARMRAGGVIASIQPQFVLTDGRWVHKVLPDDLLAYSYAWKTLLDAGIACCGGSDAPVESPEPLLGIYDAIFRPCDVRGPKHKESFRPEEKLSVTEAVDLYTKGGAYATMREHDLGQLLPGYLADFIVMDNPEDVLDHPALFCQIRPEQVWVAGRRVV